MKELINEYYEYTLVGGNLHNVLDDHNLEDDHIDWCLNNSVKENAHDLPKQAQDLELKITEILKVMTIRERFEALGLDYDLEQEMENQ